MHSRLQTTATAVLRRPGRLETIGSIYGSWTIPTSLLPLSAICYCVGCGEDVSFDAILAEKYGCNVWSYDPTPRAAMHITELRECVFREQPMAINSDSALHYDVSKETIARWHFVPVGVWSKTETMRFFAPANDEHVSHSILNLQNTDTFFQADCRTLSSLMNDNHHDHIDLLKLDIEGAEYEVIENLLQDNIRPKILCVEFDEGHKNMGADPSKRIAASLRTISSMGYWLAHRNNWDYTFIL